MKKSICVLLIVLMALFLMCGCAADGNAIDKGENSQGESSKFEEPELSQIRSICKLATLECYYHNVAKSTKEKGTGVSHWGEVDRKFWVEYKGTVKIGVDMSRGSMDVDGTNIIIYMPEAEILSVKPDYTSMDNPILESDSWNSNPIGAEDVTSAINAAEQNIRESIENDSSLLVNAQDRAQKLIENYINQLGEMSGVQFTITWKTVHNDSASEL